MLLRRRRLVPTAPAPSSRALPPTLPLLSPSLSSPDNRCDGILPTSDSDPPIPPTSPHCLRRCHLFFLCPHLSYASLLHCCPRSWQRWGQLRRQWWRHGLSGINGDNNLVTWLVLSPRLNLSLVMVTWWKWQPTVGGMKTERILLQGRGNSFWHVSMTLTWVLGAAIICHRSELVKSWHVSMTWTGCLTLLI